MAGMEMSGDDRMWDLLVRVVRTQRQRRFWGQEEPTDRPSEEHGGAEQPTEQGT